MEKIAVRQLEDLNTTDGAAAIVAPLWELLALFGLIGTVAGSGIATLLMLALHWSRRK